ncbi:MAG: NAD(P)-binding domain-containing protein [Deltaproteobacteria bacterium]|nr:NAD(P)-binding domain-containing protein [Deltaproteobacteria bacterium]
MGQITRTAVIGSGIMGHGIALVCARSGVPVTLFDISAEALENAAKKLRQAMRQLVDNDLAASGDLESVLKRIAYSTNMAEAVKGADIVFEAVPEKLPLKRSVYADLEAACAPQTIFASNTSGIPINTLAALTKRPERFVGTHFFMPAHLIPLVEVIQGDATREDGIETVMAFLAGAGKIPVRVRRDIPGFIANRLQHALAREAMSLVQKGIASAEDVDAVVKTSLAVRMLFTGPVEQRDFNGLDTHMSIAEYLYKDLEDTKTPLAILADKVAAGDLGIKSGKGFYDWRDKDIAAVNAAKNQHLIDVLKLTAS